jgi:hypothetical protein
MCAHAYQDTLHDFSPIGCLTKMTPIYMCFLFLPSMLHRCLGQGCTNTRRQVTRETKFLTKMLNVFEFSVWYLFDITARRLEFCGDT